jgi:hypothetical protein
VRATIGLAVLAAACATGRAKDGALVTFAPAGVTEPAAGPRRYAVIVGANDFDDPRVTPLRYAEADARALAAALGGFDDVRLLTGPETTRTAILGAIAETQARARGARDTVVVYFSTHGSLGRAAGQRVRRYLFARDTRLDLVADTGISVDGLIEAMAAMPSRRQVLILAACHSGQGKSHLPRDLADKLAGAKAPLAALDEVSEAVITLAAAAFGESAREDDRLGHDVYTYFLLEALEHGDRDGDGAVTVSEAHDYARERTYLFTDGQQRPFAESQVLGVDPIVLAGVAHRAARPVLFSYSRSSDGLEVVVDGRLKGVLPGGVALEPGRHRLALTRGPRHDPLYDGTIAVGPGEAVDLYDYLPAAPAWQVALTGGVLELLTDDARRYLPAAAQLGVETGAANWPLPGLELHAGARVLYGAGRTAGFGETLAFAAWGLRLGAGLRAPLASWGRFTVEAGVDAGGLWARQDIHADRYQGGPSLFGATASGDLRVAARVSGWLDVGVELEPGVIWAALGGPTSAHAALAGGAFARFRP